MSAVTCARRPFARGGGGAVVGQQAAARAGQRLDIFGLEGQRTHGLAQAELFAYSSALAQERLSTPRDDIISAIVHAEVDGDRLTEMEVNLFFLLLAVAGNETTRNLTAHGMIALFENPDQRRKLQENPELLNSAIEATCAGKNGVVALNTANDNAIKKAIRVTGLSFVRAVS